MSNFFSASQEEQQEILLTFWEKFKYLIIFALISIIAIIAGRDYFISSSNERDFRTASLYQSYLESNDIEMGKQILNSYPDSIYSDFVRLNEAKRSFENKESNEAIDLLKIVIEKNSGDQFNPLQVAAKTRLAKIYLDNADYDQVISLFESSNELTSTMYELKGDAENKLGQSAEARMSYMLALQTNTNQASKALINMKISDLEGETFE
jgi:predicted negative regulator of RcsB-dependent stress response